VDVPEANLRGVFFAKETPGDGADAAALTAAAIAHPIGTPPLRDLAAGRKRVLIVTDDISRPTPVHLVLPPVLDALRAAGVADRAIEFMMALGTHRHMTRGEMTRKLGPSVVETYRAHNHDWNDPDACTYLGKTEQGVEVWINKKVAEADLVIGIGRIMPIDICGFTGGGKILIPGVCGKVTNDEMHWNRIDLDDADIIGKRDNPVRASIDALARKAGLGFIVNCVMDVHQRATHVVAGDMVEAHRRGCELAMEMHAVRIPEQADIVIADSFPFDIEFWQANKALDQAALAVRDGGVLILVTPCYEGFSATHSEILEFGYPPIDEIKTLVKSGRIVSKVVGVHMAQVSRVARHRAHVILVTWGIARKDVEKAGLGYAETPQAALDAAFERLGREAGVAILKGAGEMLPVVGEMGREGLTVGSGKGKRAHAGSATRQENI
jgi:nickel-dependent lactate racemase